MPWGANEYAATGSIISAAMAALAAWLVYEQTSSATKLQRAVNTYAIRKDLIEAATAASEAIGQAGADAKAIPSANRQMRRYDGIFRAVVAMKNGGGLSDETWASVLRDVCLPSFHKADYKFGDVELSTLRDICEREGPASKDKPQ